MLSALPDARKFPPFAVWAYETPETAVMVTFDVIAAAIRRRNPNSCGRRRALGRRAQGPNGPTALMYSGRPGRGTRERDPERPSKRVFEYIVSGASAGESLRRGKRPPRAQMPGPATERLNA